MRAAARPSRRTSAAACAAPAVLPCSQPVEVYARYDASCLAALPDNAARSTWLRQVRPPPLPGRRAARARARARLACAPALSPGSPPCPAPPAPRQNQAAGAYNESALACSVALTVPARMVPPIFVYYELSGVYQNHRRCAGRARAPPAAARGCRACAAAGRARPRLSGPRRKPVRRRLQLQNAPLPLPLPPTPAAAAT